MNFCIKTLCIASIIATFTLINHEATAQNGQESSFGVGAAIGDRTGFSYKYWLNNDYAVSGLVSGIIRSNAQLYLHWDFLVHRHDLLTVDEGFLPLYYGVGFYAVLNEIGNNVAGLRAPVGIEYLLEDRQLGVFMEAAPVLQLSGQTMLNFRGHLGFRYYL